MIGVPRVALDRLKQANERLKARRERPIGKHEVMWCPDCKRKDEEFEQARRRPHEQRAIAGLDQRPDGAGKGSR